MSRRLLNYDDLGVSSSALPIVENPIELLKPKPVPVQNYVPQEPIILSKEQWDFICSRTHDATAPFTVTVTVVDKKEEEDEGVEEQKDEEPYVPKRGRKSKK